MASTRSPFVCRLGALAVAIVLAVFLAMPGAAARAQGANPLIARVNGVEIHQSDLAIAQDEIGSNMPSLPPDKQREYLITYLADVILVAQAAEQQHLADDPEVKARIAFERNKVLMEALLQKTGEQAETDDALHKLYDQVIKRMPKEEEVHARHILVATEPEANAIETELKNGADFATLAKQKSKDSSAANGGDLGWFTKDQMIPEFADVAFKLKKGEISDPVHTKFGWHVIQVVDRRIKPTPTFDQLKPQLAQFVARQAQAELVDKLRKAAKIERLDQPATPAPAPSPSLNPAAPVKK